MEDKEYLFNMVNSCLINGNYTLTEFQREILDYMGLDSSIEYGENDIEVQIEVWKDNTDEDFYYIFDTKGNLLKSYN